MVSNPSTEMARPGTPNTCAAPECAGARILYSYHCDTHGRLFQPLYVEYKAAEKRVEKRMPIDLRTKNPIKLLQCYAKLKEIYELRREYRQKAFRRELWDNGHEFRLQKILEWMQEVEDRLSTLFSSNTLTPPAPTEEREEEDVADEKVLEECLEEVRRYNAKVLEEERTWKEVIPNLILERAEDMQRRVGALEEVVAACKRSLTDDQRRLALYDEKPDTTHYVTYLVCAMAYIFKGEISRSEKMLEVNVLTHLNRGNSGESPRIRFSVIRMSKETRMKLLGDANAVAILTNIRELVEDRSSQILLCFLRAAIDAHCVGTERRNVKVGGMYNFVTLRLEFRLEPDTKIPEEIPLHSTTIYVVPTDGGGLAVVAIPTTLCHQRDLKA